MKRDGRQYGRARGPGGPPRGRRAGFTVVEVAIAMLVLVVAVGGLSGALMSGINLSRANDETEVARERAFQMAEAIQAETFRDIFALFNEDPNDDPGGPNTAPGAGFAVDGLTPRGGDADGMVGRIAFPTVEDGFLGLQLREDVLDPALGMPRDLDGDGNVDVANHEDDYVVLPVTVLVEWRGVTGDAQVAVNLLLVE